MSILKDITLSTIPDITDVQDNFNTLNNDKLEVLNIIQGQNMQITVDGKNITFSATGGGGTGTDGVSLQYNWDGTSLGIKREDEINYTYVNLKGQDGIIGVDGKSAYQSWLDLGNTGTEQDFIDSNKGDNGLDGRNIEIRYSETYLQYRLVGDVDWINLIQLTQAEIDLIALTARVDTLEANQGDLTSVPTELQNKTIAEMITANFTSGSNWKNTIANAITTKGVNTLATDNLATFENNIGLISGGSDKSKGIDRYTSLMMHCEDYTNSSWYPKTITQANTILVGGVFGNAIQTSGSNSYVNFGVSGDYSFLHNGLEDFAIDFWFKPIGKPFYILTNGGATFNVGISVVINNGNVRFFITRGVSGTFAVDMNFQMLTPLEFNHILISKNGLNYNMYENGTLRETKQAINPHSTNIHFDAKIGYASVDAGGIIDEFRISRSVPRAIGDFTPLTIPYDDNYLDYSLYLEAQIVEAEYSSIIEGV